MNKTILITGSTKGIGFEMARQFAEKGFIVIVSGRDETKLVAAAKKLRKYGSEIETLLMDISDEGSVNSAARIFALTKFKLDVLINNACILLLDDTSLVQQADDILQSSVQTNAYGALRVIKAFLPFMKSPSRVINISSIGGSMSEPVAGWSPAYCASKTLLNAITRQLALELTGKQISVNAVHPGWVRTDMGGSGAPRSVEQGAETPIWLATEADQNFTGKFFFDRKEIRW